MRTAGEIKGRMAIVVAAIAILLFARSPVSMQSKLDDAQMTEHRLIFIGPGTLRQPIKVAVGDMVQIAPFRYPVTPKFLGATLGTKLEGDRALDVVGQAPMATAGEGGTSRSAFLYAYASGRSTLRVTLLSEEGAAIDGYEMSYEIEVTPAAKGAAAPPPAQP
jgi:hypothetical protein